MDFLDVILTIVYMGICYGIGMMIRSRNKNNPLYKKWFMEVLAAKL